MDNYHSRLDDLDNSSESFQQFVSALGLQHESNSARVSGLLSDKS